MSVLVCMLGTQSSIVLPRAGKQSHNIEHLAHRADIRHSLDLVSLGARALVDLDRDPGFIQSCLLGSCWGRTSVIPRLLELSMDCSSYTHTRLLRSSQVQMLT